MTSTADTISRLWIAARAMLARFRAAIGEGELDAETLHVIRPCLRGLEAMVRRIVLIEAIALVRRGEAGTRVASAAGELSAGNCCDGARPPAVTLIALRAPYARIQARGEEAAAQQALRRKRIRRSAHPRDQ